MLRCVEGEDKVNAGTTKVMVMNREEGLECDVHVDKVMGPAFVLFLFYVNVSGMCPQSRLFSQPLTILAPWVLLCIRWSIPLIPWFHPG